VRLLITGVIFLAVAPAFGPGLSDQQKPLDQLVCAARRRVEPYFTGLVLYIIDVKGL